MLFAAVEFFKLKSLNANLQWEKVNHWNPSQFPIQEIPTEIGSCEVHVTRTEPKEAKFVVLPV